MKVLAPSGLYVVFAPEIGRAGWYVRVLNFATWKHLRLSFDTEEAARIEFMRWTL